MWVTMYVCALITKFSVLIPIKNKENDTKIGKNSAGSSNPPSNFIQLPLVITLSAQVTYLPWLPHLGGIHKYHVLLTMKIL